MDCLRTLNRKERFHLLHDALGFAGQTFILGHDYRARLSDCLGLAVPYDAYVAMDYQLNWLERAVLGKYGRRNIQDVDLLVAFADGTVTHLVLIEAKCDSPWDQRQLDAKVDRIAPIFTDRSDVVPRFVLTSMECPHLIVDVSRWPAWMHNDDMSYWVPLHAPEKMRVAA